MNQILATNSEKKQTRSLADSKKVITIFAIIVIVFGLVIAIITGIKLYNKKAPDTKQEELNKPAIVITQVDESVKVSINYDEGISLISYSWNDGDVTEQNINNITGKDLLIEIPSGLSNTLTITVEGTDGSVNEVTQTFERVSNGEPVIDFEIIDEDELKKIKITVTSEDKLDYITYQWEGQEENTVQAEEKKELEVKTEILRGTNKLIVIAYDINGKSTTLEKPFIGIKEPEITVSRVADNLINIKVSHDMGFEEVQFKINNKTFTYNEEAAVYDTERTLLEYTIPLQAGENTVEIYAYSLEETEATYKGKCVYTPTSTTVEE